MKFSVLLPTYNRLDLLQYAVESVTRQDYDDWELIISDNQSEDDVAGYVKGLDDPRIIYARTSHLLNVTENWNRALSLSSGEYVVMLGDDDALMPGYFTTLLRVAGQYDTPDWIYTEAYEYAYPDVLPSDPAGKLTVGRNPWLGISEACVISAAQKAGILRRSFLLIVAINFNMQHSVVHRRLIDKQQQSGDFYQSLFPDFYATLAGLMASERFVFYPEPMTVIGITRKSHGFYYFNDKLKEAKSILHTDDINRKSLELIEPQLLPNMNWIQVGWISALNQLQINYGPQLAALGLHLDMAVIRKKIAKEGIEQRSVGGLSDDIYAALKGSLTPEETVRVLLPYRAYYTVRNLLGFLRPFVRRTATRLRNAQPSPRHRFLPVGDSQHILDIYENYPITFDAIRQQFPPEDEAR
jgi:glycosyltransferase involved in cell wall biosynthesis